MHAPCHNNAFPWRSCVSLKVVRTLRVRKPAHGVCRLLWRPKLSHYPEMGEGQGREIGHWPDGGLRTAARGRRSWAAWAVRPALAIGAAPVVGAATRPVYGSRPGLAAARSAWADGTTWTGWRRRDAAAVARPGSPGPA